MKIGLFYYISIPASYFYIYIFIFPTALFTWYTVVVKDTPNINLKTVLKNKKLYLYCIKAENLMGSDTSLLT